MKTRVALYCARKRQDFMGVFWQPAEAHLGQENVEAVTQHNQILRERTNCLESMGKKTLEEKYVAL